MPADIETLGTQALDWLIATARPGASDRLAWTGAGTGDELDPTLYTGAAGIVLALLEGHRHFGDDRYADAALLGARGIAGFPLAEVEYSALYFGLTGMAVALDAVGRSLDDAASTQAAQGLLDVVRERFDGERWGDNFELLGGNAGIALGALAIGDVELAVLAVEPYLRTAEPTPGGVTWEQRTGISQRLHHISHGTLGIACALAAVGAAADRPDFTALALSAITEVISHHDAGDIDFLVPHSDPQYRPNDIERYSFGWCHGPAGDAQVFRLLGRLTANPAWAALGDRCWHTVTHSGLPRRIRPGFWDNSGRCCGTAGVLALALDRYAEGANEGPGEGAGEGAGDLEFATVLVDDIAARASVGTDGASWSNYEHRVTPSDLPPEPGWAMGNAGIVRELLRYVRVASNGDPSYAVQLPDQPPVSRTG